jgi:hypothetical protein
MRSMHGYVSGPLRAGFILLTLSAIGGCAPSPIGDPCVPESIPSAGFDPREIYLETSSVQCRTRVCMVYQLDGNPEDICDGVDDTDACVSAQALENQVFCTCRCSIPAGVEANTPLCNCADGYVCQDNVVSAGEGSRAGVAGGYCVPCIREDEDRPGLGPPFEACPDPDAMGT